MQPDFWHKKWQINQIGFHLAAANPLLVKHFSALDLTLKKGQKISPRIFLPLCGKTMDIAWLLSKGYRVVGAELSQIAVDDLFRNLDLTPKITQKNLITHYSAPDIDIFVGNIFDVTAEMMGDVHAIYDRAALVALPFEMRQRYTAHLLALTQAAPQLLICFVYDETQYAGPPFSVDAQEVNAHYQTHYDLTLLASEKLEGGLKGSCPATENVWLLTPLSASAHGA